ncbi:MAG TPA: hypothetical protein VF587_00265, partial [Solirubrobacteraceae bacterium]
MRRPSPGLARTLWAAAIAMVAGLCLIVLLDGFSPSGPIKAIETLAVVIGGAALIFGPMIAIGLRMADWREPEDEQEFERVVERSERLAREGTAAEPDEEQFL